MDEVKDAVDEVKDAVEEMERVYNPIIVDQESVNHHPQFTDSEDEIVMESPHKEYCVQNYLIE